MPGTRAADRHPLDVLILVEKPMFPGCPVMIRLLGVLHMRDENGPDDKLLGIPVGEPRSTRLMIWKSSTSTGWWRSSISSPPISSSKAKRAS
jgi:inorganic pyrophosphatase